MNDKQFSPKKKHNPSYVFSSQNTKDWHNIDSEKIFSEKQNSISNIADKIKTFALLPMQDEGKLKKKYLKLILSQSKNSSGQKLNLKSIFGIDL